MITSSRKVTVSPPDAARTNPLAVKPTIILGAPRSGTNMLRDVLVQLPGFCTWPCDEINYIWRHGTLRRPTDEFTADDATPAVRRYVRRAFERLAARRRAARVVEKTCANSLRVAFVERVVPEASYVVIVRDGRDAAASAMRRWTAPLDLPYLLRKARFVPWTDLPYYGLRYLGNRLYRVTSAEKRLATWGPRFAGMTEILERHGLAGVCAAQWARCVTRTAADLAPIAPERVCRVRYEEFVHRPAAGLQTIAEFLGAELPPAQAEAMTREVTDRHVGGWRRQLTGGDLERALPLLAPVLATHGYR